MKNENILISNPHNFKGTAAIHLLGLSFKYAVSTQCALCHLPIRHSQGLSLALATLDPHPPDD